MERIRLAVFDMDGLIFDSEREFMKELMAVMAEYGYKLTEEIYKSTIGLTGRSLIEKMRSNYGEDYPFKEISKKARERVSKTALDGKMKIKVECSKPEPDIFLKACEKEGFSEKTAVILEDSPNGVTAGFRAGIFVICIPDLVTPAQELTAKAGVAVKDAYEAKNIIKMMI